MSTFRKLWPVILGLIAVCGRARAWDYEAHHAINELALASLPADFGVVLTPELKERVAYLAGEPDRWRNSASLTLRQGSAPDHYFDLEDLALLDLTPDTLPPLRYDFAARLAEARAAHLERFAPIDPARDADHTRELDGFLPWAITENYEKLKSDFSVLRTFRADGGTAVEIANAAADCIYVMGVMGHYAGDASQPLHTTKHFNGWVGDNPRHFTTRTTFHSWIDGGYFRKTGGIRVEELAGRIQPATPLADAGTPDTVFRSAVGFITQANRLVTPLYEMEQDGRLSGKGARGREARPLLDGQLAAAGQWLGDLWLTAWQESAVDPYLRRQLELRAASAAAAEPGAPAP